MFGFIYKKSLPNPRSLKFSPVFSSSCSILYVLYSVRSIINFGLIFFCIVQSVDPSSFIYFLHIYWAVPGLSFFLSCGTKDL